MDPLVGAAGRSRWWLLSLVVTVVASVAVVAGSAAGPGPETRVRATSTVTVDAVGRPSSETAGGVGCLRPARPAIASGSCVATNTVRYGPSNPGPLLDDVASTFRSGSYTSEVLQSETTLYRVYGGESGPIGSYWSRTAPSGPMQAQIDSALNPAWGNTATNVATIRVPAGTTIYDGVAAAQSLPGGGTLLGGDSQVYIPKVNPDWLVP